jgi:hypothetical protein
MNYLISRVFIGGYSKTRKDRPGKAGLINKRFTLLSFEMNCVLNLINSKKRVIPAQSLSSTRSGTGIQARLYQFENWIPVSTGMTKRGSSCLFTNSSRPDCGGNE